MKEDTLAFASRDGLQIQTWRWAPEGAPRAVVQVQHGLGEHGGRYRRFAEALTAAGYLVYAPDGRGSGRTAAGRYGHWGQGGWPGWVDDLNQLNQRIRADHPGARLAIVGHSMGSFATQQYLLDHSADVDAAVLIGSSEVSGIVDVLTAPGPVDLSVFN
jgi:alpha-beta hydrolase superfamily lysophospholipase